MQVLQQSRYYLLEFALLCLPVAFFLGKSSRVVFFPSYLIGLLGLSLLLSARFRQFFTQQKRSNVILVALLTYLAGSSFLAGESYLLTALYLGHGLLLYTFIFSFALINIEHQNTQSNLFQSNLFQSNASHFESFMNLFICICIISACLSVTFAIYVFYALDYQPLVEARLYALGGIHNPVVSALSYGAILVMAIVHLWQTPNTAYKTLLAIAAGILIVGIIYTGTRSVWVGLITAGFSFIFILPNKNKRDKQKMGGGILIACLIGILLLWAFGLHEEILRRSTSFRLEIWTTVLKDTMSNAIIFGHGLGADETVHYQQYTFEHAHSIFFATLFYGGIIGLFLFLTCLLHIVYKLVNATNNQYAVYALPMLTFAITCLLFDGNKIMAKVNFIWIVLWLPIAFSFINSGDKKVESHPHK